MAVELVRIDDRLIHGQVATTWLKDYQIEQVLIVDDAVSQDEMRKTMVSVAAPVDVKVKVFSSARFQHVMQRAQIKRRTLLLLTNPITAEDLVAGGFPISEIIVGGMRRMPEREIISKAVSATAAEQAAFRKLGEQQVKLTIQTVPRDEKKDLLKLLH
ncbi:PTS sugar transporter subunit IIB [Lactobacillus sp. DCY120]|uniref:PTS sugar transporter subunit IIB n=1 Tax=Bombilactobacillus apium TaxID=2675299 RepID=A0A850R4S4_9LACO|nr:PTS sugar transporter subunit IIB [Bombilactobacillus apium]NVY96971.1 PTS sugar transporter subunit IIB [Bombilactobacillus apium]